MPPAITLLDRYRGALLGLAAGDALGTTLEFPAPGTFTPVHDMVGGGPFDLKAGEWTDDTSMALCLAESLIETGDSTRKTRCAAMCAGGGGARCPARGQCFDIGDTVTAGARALRSHRLGVRRIDRSCEGRQRLVDAAGADSAVLCGSPRGGDRARRRKLDDDARGARSARRLPRAGGAHRRRAARAGRRRNCSRSTFFESFVESVGPLSPRIAEVAAGSFARKQPPDIRGTGYVVESLEAALWAFAASTSFRGARCWPSTSATTRTQPARCSVSSRAHTTEPRAIPAEWRARLAHLDVIEGLAVKLLRKAIAPIGRRKHVLDLTSGASIAG